MSFQSKMNDVVKDLTRSIARYNYTLRHGFSGKPWEAMSLEEVDDIIRQRAREIENDVRMESPQAQGADIAAEVKARVEAEFGIGGR